LLAIDDTEISVRSYYFKADEVQQIQFLAL